ncbi:MAG: 16S rRNA (guanine(966)-N(2))-methyltransferase RsmD [Betaproteobacteria bacterium]|nr:16S rRNA (guanine(966)-N(2))-methyltransferase RsmD [Betaproteobacteria bacterium]
MTPLKDASRRAVPGKPGHPPSRVRIIGGAWRSRLIEVAAVPGLRPTPDRVRETLFNWLGQDLTGRACLDLFAGSGALGFEAASRGAAHVTLLETDQRALAALRQNARALGAQAVEIVCCDALEFSRAAARRYDVVFLDPPYRRGLLERIAPCLADLLEPGAMVYAEAEAALEVLGTLPAIRRGRAGQVFYHLFQA